ncbi:hypothetical protein MRX96_022946 [Rhipicephalus microplus]
MVGSRERVARLTGRPAAVREHGCVRGQQLSSVRSRSPAGPRYSRPGEKGAPPPLTSLLSTLQSVLTGTQQAVDRPQWLASLRCRQSACEDDPLT